MEYSRRNFIKAAGVGAVAVTTTVSAVVSGAEVAAAAPKPSPLAIPDAMNRETNTFNINGKNYRAEYEARTTLWEVIAVKLGLTGTNRSCNRADRFIPAIRWPWKRWARRSSQWRVWAMRRICIPCSA